MDHSLALIGYGEAAQAFADAAGWGARAAAYDRLTDDPAARASKLAGYERGAVRGAESVGEAVRGAPVVLSLVTADQALAAAEAAAAHLAAGALFCDMNSVSPATKRRAAAAVERAGARYVDVAIMAPVHPGRLSVPLMAAGPHAGRAQAVLEGLGFCNVALGGPKVGDAAAVKLLRSVIVKGIEALTAEAFQGADAAGLTEALYAALGEDWRVRAPYNLERMAVHGTRRAAEMEEAARTLDELGVEPLMTSGTVERQRMQGFRPRSMEQAA